MLVGLTLWEIRHVVLYGAYDVLRWYFWILRWLQDCCCLLASWPWCAINIHACILLFSWLVDVKRLRLASFNPPSSPWCIVTSWRPPGARRTCQDMSHRGEGKAVWVISQFSHKLSVSLNKTTQRRTRSSRKWSTPAPLLAFAYGLAHNKLYSRKAMFE